MNTLELRARNSADRLEVDRLLMGSPPAVVARDFMIASEFFPPTDSVHEGVWLAHLRLRDRLAALRRP